MKRPILCALLALGAACQTVAETGRSQLILIPDSELVPMALQAYEEETSKYPLVTSGPSFQMVQRLGQRLAAASGLEADWEFRLLEAPDVVNAFALPGGKVAVFTGILPITQNEDALAAVVGHEIAHVTAQHGNERMSQAYAQQGLLLGAGAVLDWRGLAPEQKNLWLTGLNIGSQLGLILPYSRTHESEADEIGLRYLVRAGYDENQAPLLWERMAQLSGGASDPVSGLLSTHPDPLDRAKRLRELIPRIVAEERGPKP